VEEISEVKIKYRTQFFIIFMAVLSMWA